MQKLMPLILLIISTIAVTSIPVDPEIVGDDKFANVALDKVQDKSFIERNKALTNCSLDQAIIDEIQSYQDTVNQITALFINGTYKGITFDTLAKMTDTFGHRMTGTQALEDTIDWILNKATLKFFDNIYTEPVTAPHWVRNNESLHMMSPRVQKLGMLGLGSSIATPPEGITAPILVVTSFDDLALKADQAVGKIVVYNAPFVSYEDSVQYRINGAKEAAKVGGVASLARSVTPFSIATPHTGGSVYSQNVTKIPAASITTEDAEMLDRMTADGDEVILHLTMEAENLGDFSTRNAIVEIRGTTNPEEVVVVSGHIDSWDVGTAAMDDGGGVMISYMAAEAIMELNLAPRRTFRTVFFTAEEQGIFGGRAYFAAHGADRDNFQIMLESDYGTFNPRGIYFSGVEEAVCMMQEIVSLTSNIGTDQLLTPNPDSPDIIEFQLAGVPTGSLYCDSENYLWFHHSEGDTMAVQDSDTMDKVSALWTSVAYVLADVSFRLPHE